MKSITIRQVRNGWCVYSEFHMYAGGIAADENTHVFQSIPQLQDALPGLLGEVKPDPMYPPKLTSEQCLESHKKAVEEFEAKARQQVVIRNPDGSVFTKINPNPKTHDD